MSVITTPRMQEETELNIHILSELFRIGGSVWLFVYGWDFLAELRPTSGHLGTKTSGGAASHVPPGGLRWRLGKPIYMTTSILKATLSKYSA